MAGVGETVVLADAVAVGADVSAAGRAVFASASANTKQRLSFMVGQRSVRFAMRQLNREWILLRSASGCLRCTEEKQRSYGRQATDQK